MFEGEGLGERERRMSIVCIYLAFGGLDV